MMTFEVDHAVVNVLTRMDEAVARFGALGFTLTARGFHSLGSINHLMMFGHDYLELVGIEPEATVVRREIADSPPGLNGLVFKTGDARKLHDDLRAAGIPALPAIDFDRPVEVAGATERAAFTTVRIDPEWLAGGRIYFCEHKTPHLVWRPDQPEHRNGAQALAGLTIVVPDPDAEGRRYARLLGCSHESTDAGAATLDLGAFRLALCTPEHYRRRYGALGCSDSLEDSTDGNAHRSPKRAAYMGALGIRSASLDKLRACLRDPAAGDVRWHDDGSRVTIAAASAFDCTLEFVT